MTVSNRDSHLWNGDMRGEVLQGDHGPVLLAGAYVGIIGAALCYL